MVDGPIQLIQIGLILTALLAARAFAVRRLPADLLPTNLVHRVEVGNRVCPWLLAASVAMTLIGVVLSLAA